MNIYVLCEDIKDAERMRKALMQDVGVLVDWEYGEILMPEVSGENSLCILELMSRALSSEISIDYEDYFSHMARIHNVSILIIDTLHNYKIFGRNGHNMARAWLTWVMKNYFVSFVNEHFSRKSKLLVKEELSRFVESLENHVENLKREYFPNGLD